MKQAVRDPVTLCRMLELPRSYEPAAIRAAASFPVFAPREFIGRMVRGEVHDPLLRQVLPLAEELETAEGFTADPVADHRAIVATGLLQKYAGRVLIVSTGACAVHCRYCFRRHFPYAAEQASRSRWAAILQHLQDDRSIDEVILSGGDPLTLSDERLSEMVDQLGRIPHLRRLRVHTRLPIVIPQRVTDELIRLLRSGPLAPIVVVHANHPQELDASVLAAFGRLVDAGIPLLNQAVLLRGVNDAVEPLEALSRRLVDHRVMPYYLHQLDRVAGAQHFETPAELGPQLIEQLRARLPGYAVPRLVREIPGELAKTALA